MATKTKEQLKEIFSAGKFPTQQNYWDLIDTVIGNCLKQVDCNSYQGEVGEIVQHTGQTDSKYTNGYTYKKVGERITIPAGTSYINVNDSTGALETLGIPNGRYYKITDENDTVSSHIRLHIHKLSRNNVDCGWVPIRSGEDNTIYFSAGELGFIDNELSRTTNTGYFPSTVTFENGKTVNLGSNSAGSDNIMSKTNFNIYENADGIRLYTYPSYGINSILALEYIESEDVYQVITYPDTFYGNLGQTAEEVVIDNVEWVQWNTQPSYSNKIAELEARIAVVEEWIEH